MAKYKNIPVTPKVHSLLKQEKIKAIKKTGRLITWSEVIINLFACKKGVKK